MAVLALVAGGLFAWDALRDDDDVAKPSKQPVVVNADDATDARGRGREVGPDHPDQDLPGLRQAGRRGHRADDDGFAKEFRETTDDVKAEFVADKTELQVRVVAQGVVRATRTEVQALLFLNQYVSKDGGDTTYTAVPRPGHRRAHRRGWLVSDIDTK